YWIELKAKTKTKAADSRRHIVRDSNGPNNKLVPLNEVEKRVLALVDPVAVKKLLNVWIPIVNSAHRELNLAPHTYLIKEIHTPY
ncbi:jg26336, partial [Pararge aegeria aegeria]